MEFEQDVDVPSRSLLAAADSESSDSDNVIPLYREISASMNGSRWDRIPPLRPIESDWQERNLAAPMSTHDTDQVQADGSERLDAPVDSTVGESLDRKDLNALPEESLTHQWGLLGRFQQTQLAQAASPIGDDAGLSPAPAPQNSESGT